MMKDFVKHVAKSTGMSQKDSRVALGIVLNASERQGSEFTTELYKKMPGARTLSAKMGDETGAATGVIARLIEQTPGGRMAVATTMIRNLQKAGLGHAQIAGIFPAVSSFCEEKYGLKGFGHLGDLLGSAKADEKKGYAVA
ncbi:MAG: hypothetical protein CMK09_16325 [Ponticaulis sp.]|nr:hypothetical protein [Ponticaulis sp.]|tara:strand:+ start:47115 stop:47537 length:423 start_codon:yes stop_codon:yes gene_type:complete